MADVVKLYCDVKLHIILRLATQKITNGRIAETSYIAPRYKPTIPLLKT